MDRRALYNEFLKRFPLESLSEMTLEEYTNLDREDSFCYWLERKTSDLGSIWGGAAYKFGIFKFEKEPNFDNSKYAHDNNYSWSSRLGKTSDEAFKKVRNAIIKIANYARNAEWQKIEEIKELWPVTTWKIAFLYSKEQLLPVYDKNSWLVPLATHFGLANANNCSRVELYNYLIEQKGEKDLYVFYDELCEIIKNKQANKKNRVWLFSPGENACMWDECRNSNTVRLGWDPIGDINNFKTREDLVKKLQDAYEKKDASFMNDSLALWQFSHDINIGDVVYAKKGITRIIGRGVIESDYYYDETLSTYRHARKINWTHIGEWEYPSKFALKTLTDITKYHDFVKNLNDLVISGKYITPSEPSEEKRYWWLVASPKIWKFSEIGIGEIIEYSLVNENGNKRRIYQNFLNAKAGDMVFGYASTPTLQLVTLGEIAKDTDEEHLYFRKTENLLNPISFSDIKDDVRLQKMEFIESNGQGSLFKVNQDEHDVLMEIIQEENNIKSEPEKYNDKNFLEEVYISQTDLSKLKTLLKMKKNIILQGAPGVGKTFAAKRLAYTIMGEKDEKRVEMVQFHQNCSYEDFIMGYKPNEKGNFVLKDGTFYKFCKKAQNTPDKDFFFIIDEINRGNLSKIFGELLMLIENSHRDEEIKLAYTDELFAVPSNVYIIGMMNTADRSLAMIDYALRRRFSFFEMLPGFSSEGFKLQQKKIGNEKLDKVIDAIVKLNEIIANDDSLGNGFCIGHSYFCIEENKFSQEWLEGVIEYEIAPMLKEYWFDDIQKYKNQIEKLTDLMK